MEQNMELIEKMADYIKNSDQSNWYYLKIEQPGLSGDSNFLITQWRCLMNSKKSMGGLNNRVFIRRYITGGFWVRFMDGGTDKLLVMFQSKKNLEDTGFKKHMIMRYYSSCRRRPEMSLNVLKPLDGKTLYNLINESITKELDVVFGSGNIPQIQMSKFGSLHGSGSKINT